MHVTGIANRLPHVKKSWRAILVSFDNGPVPGGDWRDEHGWMTMALTTIAEQEWSVVVLHDISRAALTRLGEFLHVLEQAGAEFTHEPTDRVFRAARCLTEQGRAG